MRTACPSGATEDPSSQPVWYHNLMECQGYPENIKRKLNTEQRKEKNYISSFSSFLRYFFSVNYVNLEQLNPKINILDD